MRVYRKNDILARRHPIGIKPIPLDSNPYWIPVLFIETAQAVPASGIECAIHNKQAIYAI